jgi:hypothetical protein
VKAVEKGFEKLSEDEQMQRSPWTGPEAEREKE